ncbi:MAG: response regulator [Acidobacteriota bacterium]|nr:response regulator [Acidobacteriota bacterium]
MAPQVHSPAPAGAELSGAEKILLVEDDSAVRTLATAILKGKGYEVLAADNPNTALTLATDSSIDLLVTDIVMPGMNGVELAERLTARRPDLKVLLLSGYAERAIIEDKLADPRTPFLGKPFKVADLLAKVREVLDSG